MSERPPISPRSPRAALEPEQVPPPPKRSERARQSVRHRRQRDLHRRAGADDRWPAPPTSIGKQRFEAAGPLQEDKVVNIPARAGISDIADLLQREGVIDVSPWVFIGGVFALKARGGLKSGEYQFQKHASLRDVVDTIVEGKVVQHPSPFRKG